MLSGFFSLLVVVGLRYRRITAAPVLSPRSCRLFPRPVLLFDLLGVPANFNLWGPQGGRSCFVDLAGRYRTLQSPCRTRSLARDTPYGCSVYAPHIHARFSSSISPAFDAGSPVSFDLSITRSIDLSEKGAASLPLPLCIRLCMADFLIGAPANFNLWGERKRPCNYR